MGNMT